MTCKRHEWIWIPRSDATFTNQKTGELVAVDVGHCRKCGKYASRVHVYSPGDQVAAEMWGQKMGLKMVRRP